MPRGSWHYRADDDRPLDRRRRDLPVPAARVAAERRSGHAALLHVGVVGSAADLPACSSCSPSASPRGCWSAPLRTARLKRQLTRVRREHARRSAGATRRPPTPDVGGLIATQRLHGFRTLVAAADPGAVLRAGLDRRAHRHQASAARIARAAAVVLPRPQFPAQRAARQGDRGVHRGRQGRSADDRPALRARQPVPPPGRDRPRDPHAPEPARPRRPAGARSARSRSSSWRRTSTAPGSSTAPRSCFTKLDGSPFELQSLGIPAADLRAGKGLAEGDRRDAAHGGAGQAAVLQGDRALLLRAGAGRAAALAVRRSARDSSTRRWPNTSCARAQRFCWATSRRSRATTPAAIAAWQRIESQNPAFLGLVADRLADAYRRTGDAAQGIRVLRNYEDQYPSLDLLTRCSTRSWRTKAPKPRRS